jgi:hypothetical protein
LAPDAASDPAQDAHFVNRRDHREHDPDPPPGARAQDRTELLPQQFGVLPRHSDAVQSEERVRFGRQRDVGQRLVATDIQRPAPCPWKL